MSVVRISDDAVALALGADALATAFERQGATVERVSSWGMHWLEPLVDFGGVGYGNATPADVPARVAPPSHAATRASHTGLSFRTERRCIGEVPAR